MDKASENPPPIDIPLESLSKETLNALVEEFILREGTDYGHSETSLPEKTNKIIKQLRTRTAKIIYCPASETTTIVRVK